MAFEIRKKTFKLPSGRKVTMRAEKVQDDITGMKIATEGIADKNDKTAVFYMLQKVKVLLTVTELDDEPVKIATFKDFEELSNNIQQDPQDFKVVDTFYVQFNGSNEAAESYVKNLLNATT